MRPATSREVWRVNLPAASSSLLQQAESRRLNAGHDGKMPVFRGILRCHQQSERIPSHSFEGQTSGPHDCQTLRLLQHRRHIGEEKEIETEVRKLTVKWWSDNTARRPGNRSAGTDGNGVVSGNAGISCVFGSYCAVQPALQAAPPADSLACLTIHRAKKVTGRRNPRIVQLPEGRCRNPLGLAPSFQLFPARKRASRNC